MACYSKGVDKGGLSPNMESLRMATEMKIEARGHELRRRGRGRGPIRLEHPDDMGEELPLNGLTMGQ